MAGDDEPQEFVKVAMDFSDLYADISAFRVSESDRYLEGFKYSMQYGNAAGETILRYDNFTDHPDAGNHHKHRSDGTVVDIEFNGLRPLF